MYIIKKADHHITDIFDKAWESANVAEISRLNWSEYNRCPNTTAKIMYSDYGIHVQMKTDENPITATRRVQNSDVCEDSCMEFFFRPNEADPRYINLEFNPFATMYFGVRTDRYNFENPDKDKDFFEAVSHVDEKYWILQYTVPFAYIDEVFGGHTKQMYGNIYKCGGEKPHYATFYPVNTEKPDFHLPETFGSFVLE